MEVIKISWIDLPRKNLSCDCTNLECLCLHLRSVQLKHILKMALKLCSTDLVSKSRLPRTHALIKWASLIQASLMHNITRRGLRNVAPICMKLKEISLQAKRPNQECGHLSTSYRIIGAEHQGTVAASRRDSFSIKLLNPISCPVIRGSIYEYSGCRWR